MKRDFFIHFNKKIREKFVTNNKNIYICNDFKL